MSPIINARTEAEKIVYAIIQLIYAHTNTQIVSRFDQPNITEKTIITIENAFKRLTEGTIK